MLHLCIIVICRVKEALDLLVNYHDAYRVLPTLVEDNGQTDLLELSGSHNMSINEQLHGATDLRELTSIFKSLWGRKEGADEEEVMIMDTREDSNQYDSSFLINWKAQTAMGE